ncbi:DUF4190 domain-containing protein [Streptomyces sp. KR80]|uniref:DUF4190 domain-containing protein n=1 Tax=Streptomyces sp. KR80 TaxID=3457426 RepID=UPI003FCF8B21
MSDNAASPQPEPAEERDPWAPPEQPVSLDKPQYGAPRAAGPPPATAMPAPPSGTGAVPPPPIAPTGPGQPGPYGSPYGGSPYGTAGYGGAQPGGYPGYQGHPGSGYGQGWQAMPMGPSNGLGVAALVLGIIGTVLFFANVFAVILGILAIIFGAVGRAKAAKGEATNGGQALAGLILGVVAIVAAIGFLVAIIAASDDFEGESEQEPFSSSLVWDVRDLPGAPDGSFIRR